MKVYTVYESGFGGRHQTDHDIKVYKNEEDAKNFCKEQPHTSCYGVSYIDLEAEGF